MKEHYLRYPIGQFGKPSVITTHVLENWIKTIGFFPELLSFEVALLADDQLDTHTGKEVGPLDRSFTIVPIAT